MGFHFLLKNTTNSIWKITQIQSQMSKEDAFIFYILLLLFFYKILGRQCIHPGGLYVQMKNKVFNCSILSLSSRVAKGLFPTRPYLKYHVSQNKGIKKKVTCSHVDAPV